MKLNKKFKNKKSTEIAADIIKSTMNKIDGAKTQIIQDGSQIKIRVSSDNPSRKKAAYYTAKRLSDMIARVDEQI